MCWASAVRRWHSRCALSGEFGAREYWQRQYQTGKAPGEWFLSAEKAAASTAMAFGAHERWRGQRLGAFARVLHLGCGTSALGTALVSELSRQCQLSARIMNTDASPAAVAAAAAAVDTGASQQQQAFKVWDAAIGTDPPTLPSPLFACGASSRYDLLVDKGTLDALTFSSSDDLIAYLASLRKLLMSPSVDSAVPPLLVHFTDDPPEIRGELFAAAFPQTGEEQWSIACVAVDDDDDEEAADGAWTYYRYTAFHDPLR